jgi:hypothetical protein
MQVLWRTDMNKFNSLFSNRNFNFNLKCLPQLTLSLVLFSAIHAAQAEPYLAVRTGQKCMACHVNPSGGGKRTKFGRIYGQTVLPSRSATNVLFDEVNNYLDMGADIRGSLSIDSTENEEDKSAFTTDRASLYLEARVVPERVTLYLDERLAPGASNREAWMMYQTANQKSFLKAGAFYLPYGLRIEDDTAYIRETTGVNFNNSDNGVMLGHDAGPWSTRVSLTNGTNGGAENNKDKQLSTRLAYIKSLWRVGVSANTNDGADGQSRKMYNVFGGVRLLGLELLGELDWVGDKSQVTGQRNQSIGYIEANKEIIKGHNLKGTYEWLDPDFDISENQQARTSVVWEYTPLPLMQFRLGARFKDGIPQNSAQNTDSFFGQFHVWF